MKAILCQTIRRAGLAAAVAVGVGGGSQLAAQSASPADQPLVRLLPPTAAPTPQFSFDMPDARHPLIRMSGKPLDDDRLPPPAPIPTPDEASAIWLVQSNSPRPIAASEVSPRQFGNGWRDFIRERILGPADPAAMLAPPTRSVVPASVEPPLAADMAPNPRPAIPAPAPAPVAMPRLMPGAGAIFGHQRSSHPVVAAPSYPQTLPAPMMTRPASMPVASPMPMPSPMSAPMPMPGGKQEWRWSGYGGVVQDGQTGMPAPAGDTLDELNRKYSRTWMPSGNVLSESGVVRTSLAPSPAPAMLPNLPLPREVITPPVTGPILPPASPPAGPILPPVSSPTSSTGVMPSTVAMLPTSTPPHWYGHGLRSAATNLPPTGTASVPLPTRPDNMPGSNPAIPRLRHPPVSPNGGNGLLPPTGVVDSSYVAPAGARSAPSADVMPTPFIVPPGLNGRVSDILGAKGRDLRVEAKSATNLLIRFSVSSPAEAEALTKKISAMPELGPYRVDFEVMVR